MLLFQFRVTFKHRSFKRRFCEERILHSKARNAEEALVYAKKRGRESKFSWGDLSRGRTDFEFIGVRELICCETVCEPDEVWYQIVKMVKPMERRHSLIPPKSKLLAIMDVN